MHSKTWNKKKKQKICNEKKQCLTRSSEYNVKVQTVDTNAGVILDSQVNVFLDTESKVSGAGEVLLSQFVFPYLRREWRKWSFT